MKSGCCARGNPAAGSALRHRARPASRHSTSCATHRASHSPPAPGASWMRSACGRRSGRERARKLRALHAAVQGGAGQGALALIALTRSGYSPSSARHRADARHRRAARPASMHADALRLGVRPARGSPRAPSRKKRPSPPRSDRSRPRRARARAPGPVATGRSSSSVQSGTRSAVHGLRQALDELGIHAAAASLVGAGGIGEAIADHPLAARQRRADEVADVQRAGGEHQQRLGHRGHGLGAALEHDLAHALGQRRAARLARGEHRQSRGAAATPPRSLPPSTCRPPRCPRA